MSSWETVFFWIAVAIYGLSFGGYLFCIIFKSPRFIGYMTVGVAAGFASHTAAIAARYAAQGHLPWSGDYEYSLMGGWFIIAGTLLVTVRDRALQGLATVTLPAVIFMMAYGVMQNPVLAPMAASLSNSWLYIHVYFAWLSFCSYTLAMAAGVLLLLKKGNATQAIKNSAYERFPSLERLDELIFRFVVFGFVTNSIMLVAGALWAKDLWGNYWNWDPVETWALVSYLMYGLVIHLRITFGWRDVRQAWLVICALSTVIISFFGVNVMVSSSLHIFNVRP